MAKDTLGKLSRFLLLAVVLQLNRLALASSSINCSLGMDGWTRVSTDQVTTLRRGEDLIIKCKGDPLSHSHLTLECNGNHDALEKNKTTLEYTWYCHIEGNGTVAVWGFENRPPKNAFQLIEFSFRSKNLDTPQEPATSTTVSNVNGGITDENQQDRSDYRLYIVVAILVLFVLAVVVALLVVVVVVKVKGRSKRNNDLTMEEGDCEHKQGSGAGGEEESLGQASPPVEGEGQEETESQDTTTCTTCNTSVLDTSSTPLQTESVSNP